MRVVRSEQQTHHGGYQQHGGLIRTGTHYRTCLISWIFISLTTISHPYMSTTTFHHLTTYTPNKYYTISEKSSFTNAIPVQYRCSPHSAHFIALQHYLFTQLSKYFDHSSVQISIHYTKLQKTNSQKIAYKNIISVKIISLQAISKISPYFKASHHFCTHTIYLFSNIGYISGHPSSCTQTSTTA